LSRPIHNAEARKAHEQDNSEFHRILIKASRNKRLQEMYESLNAHLKIARIHGTEESWRSRLDEEQSEHEQIVAALDNRDVSLVVTTLRKHIYRAKDALIASLRPAE
jgi:DNA-binding GntR family transcriptional regulator